MRGHFEIGDGVIMPSIEAVKLTPHMSYDRAQLVLAAGKRGRGKTFAISQYLEEREPRILLLDPFRDFPHIRLRHEWEDALDDLEDGSACRRRVIPPITSDSLDYADELFEACIERLRNCLLVLDEITLWSEARETTALRTLVLQGRRLGLRMLVACQRISLVPGVLLSESTQMLIFKMTRPRDLDVAEEWVGKGKWIVDERGKDKFLKTRDYIRKLDVGECLFVPDL